MIHQDYKNHHKVATKNNLIEVQQGRHKSNQQILIVIISLHQAQFKTNIQSYLSMVS